MIGYNIPPTEDEDSIFVQDMKEIIVKACITCYKLGIEHSARWHDQRAAEAAKDGCTVVPRDSHGFMAEQLRALKNDVIV
jgi:hypothetical protein